MINHLWIKVLNIQLYFNTIFWAFVLGFLASCLGIASHRISLWQALSHSKTNKLHDGILRLIRVDRLKLGVAIRSTFARQLNRGVIDMAQLNAVANAGFRSAATARYGDQSIVQHLDAICREVEALQNLTLSHRFACFELICVEFRIVVWIRNIINVSIFFSFF